MRVISIRCRCGEVYRAAESQVGCSIRCRRCGRTHVIRLPASPAASARPRLRTRVARVLERVRTTQARGGRRWTGILSAGYLLAVVLAAVLLRGFADVWWPANFLLFGGRWVLLLPLIVLVPPALVFRHPRGLALLGVGALVVLFPIMGLRLHVRRSEQSVFAQPGHLRIVTLNTADSRRVALDLARLASGWKAQVIALQECGSVMQEAVKQLDGWYRSLEGDALCLLSAYPITGAQAMDRSDLAAVNAGSTIGGSGRVVRYTLDVPGGPLRLTNLHLETARKGFEGVSRGRMRDLLGNTELRAIEARLASRWAAGEGTADVVAGDFNTPPESRIYRAAWGALRNAFSAAGSGFGYTRHNGWIRLRIDHVLVGPGWRALRAVVGEEAGSDHLPVIVDIVPRRS